MAVPASSRRYHGLLRAGLCRRYRRYTIQSNMFLYTRQGGIKRERELRTQERSIPGETPGCPNLKPLLLHQDHETRPRLPTLDNLNRHQPREPGQATGQQAVCSAVVGCEYRRMGTRPSRHSIQHIQRKSKTLLSVDASKFRISTPP